MTPPTFPELLEGATPGPWKSDGVCIEANDGNVGIVNLARHSKTDASFVARCNPATMRLVWEALKDTEALATQEGWNTSLFYPEFNRALVAMRAALTALNTPTAANKEKS